MTCHFRVFFPSRQIILGILWENTDSLVPNPPYLFFWERFIAAWLWACLALLIGLAFITFFWYSCILNIDKSLLLALVMLHISFILVFITRGYSLHILPCWHSVFWIWSDHLFCEYNLWFLCFIFYINFFLNNIIPFFR